MFDKHLHLLATGASLGLSVGILIAALRDRQLPLRIRGLVAAVALGGAAFSFTTVEAWADWGRGPGLALRWAATLGVVALWQLVRVLFDDRRSWGSCAVVTAVASVAVLANPLWLQRPGGTSIAITLVAGTLVLHILWMLLSGRGGDLDEGRRQLRLWWVAAAALYVVVVLVVHHVFGDGAGSAVHGSALVSGQITIKLCWLLMVSGHPSSLALLSAPAGAAAAGPVPAPRGAGPPAPPMDHEGAIEAPVSVAPAVPPALALRLRQAERIDEAMRAQHLYRRAGLTLSELADHLRLPEARVRLVIHEQLGFRHFNAFVNRYRLAEVASRLRNPADAHLPILSLALDAGFGSIGPFNRAFREAYGVTPTAFRRGMGPPNDERLAES